MKIQTKRQIRKVRRYGQYFSDIFITLLLIIVFTITIIYPLVKIFKK